MDPNRSTVITSVLCGPDGEKMTDIQQLYPVNAPNMIQCRSCGEMLLRTSFYYAPIVDRHRSMCKQCKSKETSERHQSQKKRAHQEISVSTTNPSFPGPPKLIRESHIPTVLEESELDEKYN